MAKIILLFISVVLFVMAYLFQDYEMAIGGVIAIIAFYLTPSYNHHYLTDSEFIDSVLGE